MAVLFSMLADLVVTLHFAFVLFVVFGGLLMLKWKRVMAIHLPAAIWGALIEFSGWICPLTPLENWLREKGGGHGHSSGFIEHTVMPLLYPTELTRELQISLGILVIIINGGIYWLVLRRAKYALSGFLFLRK